MSRKHSRREVVKGAIIAAAAAATADAAPTTKPATTKAIAVTATDVTAFERISGRHFNPAEREMMTAGLADLRPTLQRVRAAAIPPDVEPAIRFDPRPPGFTMPDVPAAFEPTAREPAYDGHPESLAFATVAELSRLIHAKRITSIELTRMYLDRLKRIGPRLNCVVNLTEDLALAQAARADAELAAGHSRGPLHGIPWGAKDLLATKGIPTTWGVKPYEHRGFDDDADVVKRLDTAGAVLVAKLSLGELAMGDVWFAGLTRNPWRPAEGSSGSSAGPAAAVAAGLVAFAIGSETLGSIISPCITCGVTGLRPTFGTISRRGAMPLAPSMDKLGPMARGVEDCALIYHAIRDPAAPFAWTPARNTREIDVGIYRPAFDAKTSAGRRKLYDAALAALGNLAGELRPVTLPPVDHYKGLTWLTIAAESAAMFSDLLESGRVRELRQQEPGSWPNAFRIGSTVPAADYIRGAQLRSILQQQLAAALAEVDCFITLPYAGPVLSYTNLTGHPSLVFRCGIADGVPIQIELIGQLYREDLLLRVGHALERAIAPKPDWPDTDKIPPLAE